MRVFASGLNEGGQIGPTSDSTVNGNSMVKNPVELKLPQTGLVTAACGADHTVFLYNDGSVWALGNNAKLHIGGSVRKIFKTPTKVQICDEKIVSLACGRCYTAYLTECGKIIYCSEKGGCRTFECDRKMVFVAGGTHAPIALDEDGVIYVFDENPKKSVIKYELGCPVFDVACGPNWILAITTEGVAYGNGQLNDFNDDFEAISSLDGVYCTRAFGHSFHAAVLAEDGSVYMWGNGISGQLGNKSCEKSFDFEKVDALADLEIAHVDMGNDYTMFLTTEGDVYGCGANNCGQLMLGSSASKVVQPMKSPLLEDITFICCGAFHTLALTCTKPQKHRGAEALGLWVEAEEEEEDEEEEDKDELVRLRARTQKLKEENDKLVKDNEALKAERDQIKADYEDLRRKMKFMKQHLAEMIKLVN